ncbi:MAG: LytTR family DNA-binding domain-containing protein [Oceanicoccus sp.]
MTVTAIVVDDESTLVDYLVNKLGELWPELVIVGTANNGRNAIALAEEFDPDIAFLDIHMPGLSGLQVAEALPENTRVVFVTAFDDFAVEAFQRAAVDYLLKPVTNSRLGLTIERLKDSSGNQDRSVLMRFLEEATTGQKNYLQWIRAGYDDTTQLIAAEDVIYFKADQKYTEVITKDNVYVVRRSIKELGEELDPAQFWQIHRGIIVRVDQVASAKRDLRGRYTISLRDHPHKLRTSQSYGHLFRQM